MSDTSPRAWDGCVAFVAETDGSGKVTGMTAVSGLETNFRAFHADVIQSKLAGVDRSKEVWVCAVHTQVPGIYYLLADAARHYKWSEEQELWVGSSDFTNPPLTSVNR